MDYANCPKKDKKKILKKGYSWGSTTPHWEEESEELMEELEDLRERSKE